MLQRTLLCLISGGLLAGGLFACGIPATLVPQIPGMNTLSEQAQRNLDLISQRFGLLVTRLNYNDARLPWQLRGMLSYTLFLPDNASGQPDSQLSRDHFDKLVGHPGFVAELNKYPTQFFSALQINALYFVHELSAGLGPLKVGLEGIGLQWDGKKYPVLSFNERQITSFSSDNSLFNGLTENALERLMPKIHHELFHVIDDALLLGEPSWSRCQPTADEQRRFHAPQNVTYHPAAGFVTPYAQTIFREDKAEVFRLMMTSTTAQYLAAWIAAGDQTLKCKQDWIRDYVSKRVPAMNADYFDAVLLGLGSETLQMALQQPEALTQLHLKGPDQNQAYWSRAEIPQILPLPATLSRYQNLAELLAERTQWTSLATLGKMAKLKKLWLADQRLNGLPEDILNLTGLESLVFLDKLSEIPAGLARLTALKELSLALSTLGSVEPLQNLPLESVAFFSTEESDLQSLFELRQAHSLSFRGPLKNQTFSLNQRPKQLRRLAIENIGVDGYSEGFEQFKTRIESFEHLSELTHLRLLGLLLPDLKTALAPLQKLEYLHLGLKEVSDFEPAILDLPKLKVLVLSPLLFIHNWNEPAVQAEQKRIQALCRERGLTCTFETQFDFVRPLFGYQPWPFSDFS
jgi:hypothetical protein